ncbi:hypothetical protein V8F06_002383 [Rhypophila decipiens]
MMAQEQGPIATAGAPLAAPSAQLPSASPPTVTSDSLAIANDPGRPRPLKRQRESTPTSPEFSSGGDLSPSKIARLASYARQSPPPSTGGPTSEDERLRVEEEQQRLDQSEGSPGQNHRTYHDLMSGVEALNRPQDEMAETTTSSQAVEAASIAVARALSVVNMPASNPGHAETQEVQSVPASAISRETMSEGPGEVVHSPAAMDIDARSDLRLYAQQPDAQMDDKTAGSLSYPGAMQPGDPMGGPAPPRGMSLPNQGLSPRSPTSSNKKHICQYCTAEFTRHHNLKSHLLTHSKEKPYVCRQCSMAFRRLHDLKRHGKLHTGEKPHICPKCNRKFARGDALARHSKGAGGCAGRRASMGGSFAEDDYDTSGVDGADDSAMAGVLYDNGAVDMTEEERRRLSLPSIKAQHIPGQPAQEGYVAHSNTYPPAGPRPPHSGLYPPNIDRGSGSSTTSPSVPNSHTPHTSISSVPVSAGSSSMYSQSGMTESPRPLSPGANQAGQDGALARQRSPAQQQHFRQPDQAASGLSLPAHGMSPETKQAWLSHYPPADHIVTQGATAPITPSPTQTAGRGRGRASSGANAGHAANGISTENAGMFTTNEHNMWAYIQQLEARMKQMEKDNTHLREKLSEHEHHFAALANEVAIMRRTQPPQPQQQPPQHQHQPQAPQPPLEHQTQQPQEEQGPEQQPQAQAPPALALPSIPTPVAQP